MIDKDGLHSIQEKVMAIKKVPTPMSVTELGAFLGMLNYYCTIAFCVKVALWRLDQPQQEASSTAKEMLQSDALLVHFDPRKEVSLGL